MRRQHQGFTLIESLIVLSLILSVLAIALSVASPTTQKVDGAQLARRISALATAIRDQYADRVNYTGLSNTSLLASGVVPPELQDGAPLAIRTTDGPITVAAANRFTTVDSPDENLGFTVSFTAPPGVCLDALPYLADAAVRIDGNVNAYDQAVHTTAATRGAALLSICSATAPNLLTVTYR